MEISVTSFLVSCNVGIICNKNSIHVFKLLMKTSITFLDIVFLSSSHTTNRASKSSKHLSSCNDNVEFWSSGILFTRLVSLHNQVLGGLGYTCGLNKYFVELNEYILLNEHIFVECEYVCWSRMNIVVECEWIRLLKLNEYFCWMWIRLLKLNEYFCWILKQIANHSRKQ